MFILYACLCISSVHIFDVLLLIDSLDLSSVEKKIDERVYLHLKDFVVDVLNIFNGCFDSNHRTSHIARNAIALEREFLDSFEQLKCCMCSDFTSSQLDS